MEVKLARLACGLHRYSPLRSPIDFPTAASVNNTDIVKMVKDGMADSAITSALDYRYAWRWALPLSVAYR